MPSPIITALALSLSLVSSGALLAQEPLIETTVRACVEAIATGDAETLVALSYPPLIKLAGGEDAMIEMFGNSFRRIKKAGFIQDSLYVGKVLRIVTTTHRSFGIIPYFISQNDGKMRVSIEGIMLGISEDGGKSWTFIEANDTADETFPLIFPDEKDLVKTLALPPSKPLQYERMN